MAAVEVPLQDIPGRCAEIFDMLRKKGEHSSLDNYLCPDTETCSSDPNTGAYNVEKNLVAQIGCAVVTGGRIEENNPFSIDINWIGHPAAPHETILREIIDKTRNEIEMKKGVSTGKTYTVSLERMRNGRPPNEVMLEVYQFLTKKIEAGYSIVGFNQLRFDIPSMFNNMKKAGVVDGPHMRWLFDSCENNSWDMGLIVKAAAGRMLPTAVESRLDFFHRVDKTFLKVKWSQDKVAMPAFNITTLHGISPKEAHDAAIDCLIPHIVFSKIKELVHGRA